MMIEKRLLLINGSPRKKGTSFSFARTIKMLWEKEGNTAEIIHAIDYYDGKEEIHQLRNLISHSDVMAVVAPLYSDTLPYHNIWFLEKLIDGYSHELKGKGFFAIGQNGFPDITRNYPLLDACKFFAEEAEMVWLGGLSYGGGAMLNGALLEDLGEKGEKLTLAFKLALQDVLSGQRISSRSQELITVKIPKILYWPLVAHLNHETKKKAREIGNVDFKRRAYLE